MDAEETLDGCFQDFIMESPPVLDPSSKKLPSFAAAAAAYASAAAASASAAAASASAAAASASAAAASASAAAASASAAAASAAAAAASATANACFDCNICLDFAADPVVTLCGHLYCWPCIFHWLHLDAAPRHCPVCKSSLSESSLIPLHGCGLNSNSHHRDGSGVPDRPRDHRNVASPAVVAGHQPPLASRQGVQMDQNYDFYGDDHSLNHHMGVLHSTASAVLGEMAFSMLPWAFRNHQDFYTSLNLSPAMSGRNQSQRWRQELRVESWLHQLWLFLLCCAFLCLVFF